MIRVVLLSFTLLLSSCANIPLGTMLEFRSFGKEDFVNIQPENIQTKIQVDDPVTADIGKFELSLDIQTTKGTRLYQFPLELLNATKLDAVTGFFSSTPAKNEYTLKLSDEAIQNFKEAQQIVQHEQFGGVHFAVSTVFEAVPEELKQIRLSIFLKLSEEKDFVTLLKDAKLEIKHQG